MTEKKYFETKISFMETQEDGTEKKKSEVFAVMAISFGTAEKKALEEAEGYSDVEVTGISIASYTEVLGQGESQAEKYFKAKVPFVEVDEKTGKEKLVSTTYLVRAENISSAIKQINSSLGNMGDYMISSVTETSITSVI